MANTELIISEIKSKANRLTAEVGALRKRVAQLEKELLIAKSESVTKEEGKARMRDEHINYQPAMARVESEEDRGEVKSKINSLVKEIDRCIALLNA